MEPLDRSYVPFVLDDVRSDRVLSINVSAPLEATRG
jgi:hypothetical protein